MIYLKNCRLKISKLVSKLNFNSLDNLVFYESTITVERHFSLLLVFRKFHGPKTALNFKRLLLLLELYLL
jgi:hypothetical protein